MYNVFITKLVDKLILYNHIPIQGLVWFNFCFAGSVTLCMLLDITVVSAKINRYTHGLLKKNQ